jgi:hypothetical protein
MKFILLLFLSALLEVSAHALTIEIIGACSDQPAYSGSENYSNLSVGLATMKYLNQHSIPYKGSESGIASILGTPTGDDSIEVINDHEMRAYGWCFEVDGVQPDLMPDQVILLGPEHLKWFYAFSYYDSGKWITYCEPAYTVKPKSLCP